MVRLLHTSDIHLGRQFPSLGEKAGEYRHQLLRTFEKIVNLAITERMSLLLISGDLFDTNRLYGLTMGRVLISFRRLETSGIRVCIIPGTHDAYSEDSLYRSLDLPQNVTLFTREHGQRTFEDLDLTIYGMVSQSDSLGESPLKNLSLAQRSKFHVGMAHCSVKRPGIVNSDAMLLDTNEIAGSGLDYLALGHWHSFQDFSRGATAACYSGSPEPLDIDQKGAGNVVLITLQEKGRVEFRPVGVGTKKCASITIDVSPLDSIADIARVVEARADTDLILEATLSGLSRMDYDLDCREIEDMLRGKFFHLRVVDKSRPKLEDVKSLNYPEKTVIGRFLRIMEEKIAAASTQEDRSICEDALRLGFALLHGRSEVIE